MKKLENMTIEELEAQNIKYGEQKEAIRKKQIELKRVMSFKIVEKQQRQWIDLLSSNQKKREIASLEELLGMEEAERLEETAAIRRVNSLFPRQKKVQEIALQLLLDDKEAS